MVSKVSRISKVRKKGTLMPRSVSWRFLPSSLAALAGAVLVAGALSGCPGPLDPTLMGTPPSGSGGNQGSGGGNGSGGSNPGTGGGGSVDCSGDNAGPMILTNNCATSGCHTADLPALSAGLNLTADSGIKSRLVDVKSTGAGASACGSNGTPYLKSGSNPATGLLIDKIKPSPPCGLQMPFGLSPLSSTQQQCLMQWATTLTMAAP